MYGVKLLQAVAKNDNLPGLRLGKKQAKRRAGEQDAAKQLAENNDSDRKSFCQKGSKQSFSCVLIRNDEKKRGACGLLGLCNKRRNHCLCFFVFVVDNKDKGEIIIGNAGHTLSKRDKNACLFCVERLLPADNYR